MSSDNDGEQAHLIQTEDDSSPSYRIDTGADPGCDAHVPCVPLLVRIEEELHVRKALVAASRLPLRTLALIFTATAFVILGFSGQLISLNLWLDHFGNYSNSFTVLLLAASITAIAFTIAFFFWTIKNRSDLRFLQSIKGFFILLALGLCNAANGVFLVSATPHTPEVLQALLVSTQIFITLIFSKIILRDTRNYIAWGVLVSFVLLVGGVLVGFSPEYKHPHMDRDQKIWTVIFAGAIIPGALYNVLASLYIRMYTLPPPHETGSTPVLAAPPSVSVPQSDDTTVKFAMLCISGLWQVFWIYQMFPLDAAPWFGTSPNLDEAYAKLAHGFQCVFSNSMCPSNFVFFILFNVAYVFSYLGSAYLNHFSATLCSMVTQLSSPFAALVLIIAPVLNVNKTSYDLGAAIGAIILIVLGSLIYSSWEEGSKEKLHIDEEPSWI